AAEDKERALSDHWVLVNGKQLSVCRVDFPVIMVCNMESLQMTNNGALDAHFSISESCNMTKILE
ncbi:hypothetical protein KI387_034766, partial [Taxus chinensis]